MRRDLVDSCPVLVFDRTPAFGDFENIDAMVDALEDAHAVQSVRVTVMTQACDPAENKIRNAIPCPADRVMDFRADRERREMDRGQNPMAGWRRLSTTGYAFVSSGPRYAGQSGGANND